MEQVQNTGSVSAKITSKFLGVVFLYLFIGLILTAVSSFVFAFFMAQIINANPDFGFAVILGTSIGAFVLSYVITIINSIYSSKTGKAPWVGFILYALCMGIGFSLILLAGVDFATIGEAFALTALCFLIMFFIGYFSKSDLSPFLFMGISILIGIGLLCAFWFIFYLIFPEMFTWLDVGISVGIVIVCLFFIGFEANQMGKIAESGQGNNNLALFCAFNLYTNFISLFSRILYLILISRSRKR